MEPPYPMDEKLLKNVMKGLWRYAVIHRFDVAFLYLCGETEKTTNHLTAIVDIIQRLRVSIGPK
jgi:hypothetical protein